MNDKMVNMHKYKIASNIMTKLINSTHYNEKLFFNYDIIQLCNRKALTNEVDNIGPLFLSLSKYYPNGRV